MFVCSTCAAPGSAPPISPAGYSTANGSRYCPATGFGPSAEGHLRIALSAPEARLRDAAGRILRFARGLNQTPQREATP